jgi:hypothetical protein
MNDTIEQVGAVDPTKETSPIVETQLVTPEESVMRAVCWFNGKQFSKGAVICSDGHRLECQFDGSWWRRGSC